MDASNDSRSKRKSRAYRPIAAFYAVDAKDAEGATALTLAAFNGHLEVVKQLIAFGAQVNICNSYEDTAEKLAFQNGHIAIVDYLRAARR